MQTVVQSALWLGALLLLGLVLAYWTWVWLAPRAEPRADASEPRSGNLAAAGNLFGRAERQSSGGAPTGIAVSLLGVVAATGGRPGYAVLRLDAKTLTVRSGDELAPGIRVAQVFPNHVVLERNGARETLGWPERGKLGPVVASPAGK